MTTGSPLTVRIDQMRCEGHGLCIQLAPAVFDLTESEVAVCHEHPGIAQFAEIKAAAAACPRQAITISTELDHNGKDTP